MVTIGIAMLVTSRTAASPNSTQKTILPMRRSGGCVRGTHVVLSGCAMVAPIPWGSGRGKIRRSEEGLAYPYRCAPKNSIRMGVMTSGGAL